MSARVPELEQHKQDQRTQENRRRAKQPIGIKDIVAINPVVQVGDKRPAANPQAGRAGHEREEMEQLAKQNHGVI